MGIERLREGEGKVEGEEGTGAGEERGGGRWGRELEIRRKGAERGGEGSENQRNRRPDRSGRRGEHGGEKGIVEFGVR